MTYAEIKDRISDFSSSNTVKLITEYSESGVDQVTDDSVINKWDEWEKITKVKRKTLEKNKNDFEAELGAKWIELNEIDSKITEAQIRKTVAEKTIETAKKGKMKGLKDAFNAINAKTNKTYNEVLFLRSILGLVEQWQNKYPELYPTVTTGPNTFDVTALWTALDNDEKALRGKFAEYYSWTSLGSNFTERLEGWKKADGELWHNEEAVRTHLETLKSALESIEKRGSLDPIEKNELEEIKRYLAGTPVPTEKRILPSELKSALRIVEFNVFHENAQKWIDYSKNVDFKTNTNEIKKIADKVNEGKIKKPDFVKYLRENFSTKPDWPGDNAGERMVLDWFFTQNPKTVIETIASQELKADSNLKERILAEMKDYKDSKDKLILLNRTVYGDGQEFTEEGIIKYYAEKLGGQNHAMKKYEKPFNIKDQPQQQEGFWRTNNPAAWLSGFALLLLLVGTIWAIHKRKTILQWWNAPSELEDELDEDEEEDY